MSNKTPQVPREGNYDNSETNDHEDTVCSTNIPSAVEECMNSINSNLELLIAIYDLHKNSSIRVSKATSVHEFVIVKQFSNEYKNIAIQLTSSSARLIELIEKHIVILIDDLRRKQRIRDELETFLDRVSLQNEIIKDAAQMYYLTKLNEPEKLQSIRQNIGSKETLLKNHTLDVASFNTINGIPVHRVESSISREDDEKQEHERQKKRGLEAYNQYILVFPLMARTSSGTSRGNTRRQRRTNVPERPQNTVNMWSVMKNSIGKDLSKIPMPVNFSEPISVLQRLVECFEYSHILDRAAVCGDALEQLAYVAAFYVSGYSTNSHRTSKPFNPLLGETFEWDRTDDYGWRVIAEQVSHHPPISALHCTAKEWTCWEEFSVVTKFRGRYLTAEPKGTVYLEFNNRNGHLYTWKKVSSTIHNIVIGKMYVEQNGEVDVIDHTNGAKCHLNFQPSGGLFGRDIPNRVFGTVRDTSGQVKWLVDGVWDKYIEIGLVTRVEGPTEKPVYKTDSKTVVWECSPLPANSDKHYNFTLFARQLNEMEDEVAPTDSRRRPDQRLMEEGNWDEANVVKVILEQKQRERRAQKMSIDSESEGPQAEAEAAAASSSSAINAIIHHHPASCHPVWFRQEVNTHTRETMYVYQKGYWEAKEKQDWSKCPNIFTV